MNVDSVFGKALKVICIIYTLSQEELAFRSNLDRTNSSMLERGIHQPNLSSLMSIAQVVNIKASDLVRLYEIELENLDNNNNVDFGKDRP